MSERLMVRRGDKSGLLPIRFLQAAYRPRDVAKQPEPVINLDGRPDASSECLRRSTVWGASITLVGARVGPCGGLHVSILVAGEGEVHANAARKTSTVRSTPRLVIPCRANNLSMCPPRGSEGPGRRSVIQTPGGQSPRVPGTPVPCHPRLTNRLSSQRYERRSNLSGSDPRRPWAP